MHKQAQGAHEAAQCAHDQDKFWEYHDKLFTNQRALGVDQLKQYAAEMGLNEEEFNACMDTGKHRQAVQQDMRDGQLVGVTGTPAFFINGRFMSGAQPYEKFVEIIEQELERQGAS